jgi:hypothetical protein
MFGLAVLIWWYKSTSVEVNEGYLHSPASAHVDTKHCVVFVLAWSHWILWDCDQSRDATTQIENATWYKYQDA